MTTELVPGAAPAHLGLTGGYMKMLSLTGGGIVVLFLLAWLAPVIAAWTVSVSGRLFSFVAPDWQNQNADIVGICILTALVSGVAAAALVMTGLNGMSRLQWPDRFVRAMSNGQRFLLVAIVLLAAVGLFLSFDGTIFEKSYSGPSVVWLGYGAWSVTFLLSLSLLVGDYLTSRPFRAGMVLVITVVFLPFLLSGSRIDFLSFMLALAAYVLIVHDAKLNARVLGAMAILAWAGAVALLIANIRYSTHDASSVAQTIPIILTDRMFYLSSIGDIGASVFQIVGLLQEHVHLAIGFGEAMLAYATRLLPGPIYANRPGDFSLQLPEPIGGGALHSLGEGYLLSGLLGCSFVGAVFGTLIAFSIFAGRHFQSTRSPVSWVVFIFPWLLLIRGGWYQFFALLKSLEILLALVLTLALVRWLGEKFSSVHGGGVCR